MITHPRFPQIRTCALMHPAPRSKQSLRNLPLRTPWSKGHLNAVLAQSTIFCRYRKMGSRLKVRVIDASRRCFRPVGRFPPTGPLGRVPRAPRYYQPTPTTQPPSRRASGLRLALPCLWSCSLPVGRTTPTGLGCFLRGARAALHDKEQLSPPRFLGDPCVHAHALRPRRSGDTRPSSAATAAFRYSDNVGSARSLSRLNHTACTPPVYASQAGSLPHHATLGSGGWPTLTGTGLAPGGSHKKVSDSLLRRYRPPLPGFAWRNGVMIKAG